MKSSLILLSGGLDSALSLVLAKQNTEVRLALTFDYGQKAASQEIQAATQICKIYDIPHQILKIPDLMPDSHPFVNQNQSAPTLAIDELDNPDLTQKTAKAVWVPNRNGILINLAAGIAEANGIDLVVVGFNKEEAQTFPDNSEAYLESLNQAFQYSTQNCVQVASPTSHLNKSEMLAKILENDFDLTNLWSCYAAKEKMCGECESCQRFKRALQNNAQSDWINTLFMK